MMWNQIRHYALKSSVFGQYKGILIADLTAHQQYKTEFVAYITQTLQVIEQNDPRRFRSILCGLKFICNTPLCSVGNYDHALRCCGIDFTHYKCNPEKPEYEWWVARGASTIVHEATHARLHLFGIPYNSETWERVERLCRLEQSRFASRLKSDHYDFSKLVPEFDPTWWRQHRSASWLQRRGRKVIRAYRDWKRTDTQHFSE